MHVTFEPGRIVVDDDGPGIPPGERERVFERFARGRGGARVVLDMGTMHG